MALNRYVKEDRTFDFNKLAEVTRVITRNLNRIIDINYYPLEEVFILIKGKNIISMKKLFKLF